MDDLYEKHFKDLRVEDGNYYVLDKIKAALAYFNERQKHADIYEELFPYLVKIYAQVSDVYIQESAAELFLQMPLNKERIEEIIKLTKGSSGYYTLSKVIGQYAQQGKEILTLFPVLYAMSDKYGYGLPGIFFNYFDHKKHKEQRKLLKLNIAKQIVAEKIPFQDLCGLIHGLLINDFPEEDINVQLGLLPDKNYTVNAIKSLEYYIPAYNHLIKDAISLIKDKRLDEGKQYTANDFLLRWAYYNDDDSLLEELLNQQDEYLAEKGRTQLGVLSVSNPESRKKYLDAFVKLLENENYKTIKGFAFKELIDKGLQINSAQLNIIIKKLENQQFRSICLGLLCLYASFSIPNKEQLLDALRISKIKDNDYVNGLITYFTGGKERCCDFCKIQPYTHSSFPSEMDKYLESISNISENTSYQKCKACGQQYEEYYFEEYDVNSVHRDESLTKTNSAQLLNYKLGKEVDEEINKNYEKDLNKAAADFYSPLEFLREPAAGFLAMDFLNKNESELLLRLMKNCCKFSLKIVLEKYKYCINFHKKSLLSANDILSFVDADGCGQLVAEIVGLQYIFEGADEGLLSMLNSENVNVVKGVLLVIAYPSGHYTPSNEILHTVYLCGLKSPDEVQWIVNNILPKYNYKAPENSIFSIMKILETESDEKKLQFSLLQLNTRIAELPAFNEELMGRVIACLKIEKLRYYSSLLLNSLTRNKKIDEAGIKQLMEFLKLPETNLSEEFCYLFFSLVKEQHGLNIWVPYFTDLINHPFKRMATIAIQTLSDIAAKGISMASCLAVLTSIFETMEPYQNEKLIGAALLHHYYHQPDELLSFIENLPSDQSRGQALSTLSDLSYSKKDISRYYKWMTTHIFAQYFFIKNSCRIALKRAMSISIQEGAIVQQHLKKAFPNDYQKALNAILSH